MLYTPKAKTRQGEPPDEFRWDAEGFARWLRQTALRSIDPALPRLVSDQDNWEAGEEGEAEAPGVPLLISYSKVKVRNLRTLWPVRELRFRPLVLA